MALGSIGQVVSRGFLNALQIGCAASCGYLGYKDVMMSIDEVSRLRMGGTSPQDPALKSCVNKINEKLIPNILKGSMTDKILGIAAPLGFASMMLVGTGTIGKVVWVNSLPIRSRASAFFV